MSLHTHVQIRETNAFPTSTGSSRQENGLFATLDIHKGVYNIIT